MKPRYGRASRHMGLLVGSFVMGNVVGIGAAALLEKRLGGLAFVLAVAIVIAFLAAGYVIAARKDKRRRTEIGELLSGRGFKFDTTPSIHSFGPFASLVEWGEWNQWIADKELKWLALSDNRLVMEREYVIGDGDNAQEFSSTLGVVLNGNCSQLQGIQLVRGSRTSRAALSDVAPLTKTGDVRFDRDWAMTRSETVPSDRAPSGPVRSALQTSPRGESWYFWEGWACCTFDGCLDATNTTAFLAHIDEVVSSIAVRGT